MIGIGAKPEQLAARNNTCRICLPTSWQIENELLSCSKRLKYLYLPFKLFDSLKKKKRETVLSRYLLLVSDTSKGSDRYWLGISVTCGVQMATHLRAVRCHKLLFHPTLHIIPQTVLKNCLFWSCSFTICCQSNTLSCLIISHVDS